jgi:hypothetical protein
VNNNKNTENRLIFADDALAGKLNDRRLLNRISYNLIIMRTSPTASSRAQPRRCIVVPIVQQQTGIVDMEIINNDGQKFRRLFIMMVQCNLMNLVLY